MQEVLTEFGKIKAGSKQAWSRCVSVFVEGLMKMITIIICHAVSVCGRAGGNERGDVGPQSAVRPQGGCDASTHTLYKRHGNEDGHEGDNIKA